MVKKIFFTEHCIFKDIKNTAELQCCSEMGEVISSDFVYMGEREETLASYSSRKYRKIFFSIKVNKNAHLRVFQVLDMDSGELLRGFKAIEA